MSADRIVEMKGIEKVFAHAHALKGVDFSVRKGEVHALLGENGAGKSTLIKVLTGVYPKDGGEIWFDGQPVEIASRDDAMRLGIAVIFQEFSLIPTLCVTQNILLGREKRKLGILRKKAMRQEVAELIRRFDFPLNPDDIIEMLSVAQKQMVEILKALSTNARLIIMDEPTASLSAKESEMLYKIIRQLRDRGVAIIYISHRLEEVFALSDRITVLRDGMLVATVDHEDIEPDRIVRMMIGKQLSDATASRRLSVSPNRTVLEVRNLSSLGRFEDVSFEVKAGEVVALTGLVGSGRTEILRSIFGADRYDSGEILFEGEKLPFGTAKVIALGFGLIPEDRRTQGFIPLLSVERNVACTNYDALSRRGFVQRNRERALGRRAVKLVDLRPANPLVSVGNLSGGNQQKAVLAKWLTRDLKVILVDEPTVGIDIGAKDEIYNFIDTVASQGVAVLLVSSDIAEVLRVAHRIIVMKEGRIIHEFNDGVATQEDILLTASGIHTKGKGA
ncbi:MAG: sugar ABC transporter ATP-binding protein [Eubacteriales bacterium]|nr:sugar ABC transporter ATP-binding protein [Christensenellaceae bacterium]MEA5066268.1 sugar ABC transporter ATP-binding protein [Eubacteriales bacterium]